MVDLVVVHYHLLLGGVTSVIHDGLRAIIQHQPGLLRSIHLIVGRRDGVNSILVSLRTAAAESKADTAIRATIDQRLDYATTDIKPTDWKFPVTIGPDTIWWFHNHHLGKNLSFTRALLAKSVSGSSRVLLQIHDFPECGRLKDYQAIRSTIGDILYPFGPNLRYVVINRRDYEVLSAAGIPESCLHLLWNPVIPVEREKVSEQMIATLTPNANRLWLYPVRARRRKNILEAGLLARMLDGSAVAVTLPAVSEPELAYYRQAEALFRDGTLPGLLGLGAKPRFRSHSLAQFAGAADAVISTSIEEGFGYQYLHARSWQIPLIAREIDSIDGFHDIIQGPSTVLYNRVNCLINEKDRAHLANRYREKLKYLGPLLPEKLLEAIADQIDEATNSKYVDYSYLSFELQQLVAIRCQIPENLDELRSANSDLIERIHALSNLPKTNLNATSNVDLENRFGAAAFANRVARILGQEAWSPEKSGSADTDTVLERFAACPYQRLLFDPV